MLALVLSFLRTRTLRLVFKACNFLRNFLNQFLRYTPWRNRTILRIKKIWSYYNTALRLFSLRKSEQSISNSLFQGLELHHKFAGFFTLLERLNRSAEVFMISLVCFILPNAPTFSLYTYDLQMII